MSVYTVEKFIVKPGKNKDFLDISRRFLKYRKEHPEKFKEIRSFKRYSIWLGSDQGAYIEIFEFDSLADYEKYSSLWTTDETIKKIVTDFKPLIDPATWSISVWTSGEDELEVIAANCITE